MRNINKNLAMHIFRISRCKVYYFDEQQIVQRVSLKQALTMSFANYNTIHITSLRTCLIVSDLVTLNYFTVKNQNVVQKILCMLKIGDNLETLDNYLSSVKLDVKEPEEGLKRFITKINRPIFIREPENQNKKTFDFIYVDINILSQWDEDRISFIQKNMNKIKDMILKKLENSAEFKKFGIPINYLAFSSIILRSNSVIRFIIEIKSI